jgi:flagellar assembly protein FliH
MPAKLLKNPNAAVQPAPWSLNAAVLPPAPERPARSAQPPDDSARFKARIAELEAAVELKSRQAYDAGFRAGGDAARQAAQAPVEATLRRLGDTLAELAATRTETIRRAEADTVRLALEIARRVLHRELSMDASALESLIHAALEKLRNQEVYRVRVHPSQEKVVKACLDQSGRGQAITVISDPVQHEGGAVFEISRGSLDASVETQLAEIERGLIDKLEARA